MARIAGVDLPRDKRIEAGLTYIYGIGPSTAKRILAATNINPDTRVKDLTDDEAQLIRDYLDANNILVEGDLHRDVAGYVVRKSGRLGLAGAFGGERERLRYDLD